MCKLKKSFIQFVSDSPEFTHQKNKIHIEQQEDRPIANTRAYIKK